MKTVSLVLGSGGARGYAHIGVIDELLARGYRINCIAGCSMGALVGGVYAAGKLNQFRGWINNLGYLDILRLADVSFSAQGALRGERIFDILDEMIGELNIEDLSLPYTAVATDLIAQQELWFQRGSLRKAIRASIAIPTLFTPVVDGNRLLVDGGLLNPLPIAPVVSAHSDLIIAVNLAGEPGRYRLPKVERTRTDARRTQLFSRWLERITRRSLVEAGQMEAGAERTVTGRARSSMMDIINQSFETMQSSLTQFKMAGYPPDLLISIPKDICRFYEFHLGPELIRMGQMIASDALDRYETAGNSLPTHELDDGRAG
ncbi:patatin-like phospholipase family protein [Aestuariirhabdus litorea]|uniref:Alpha/beta hydrolase n=1 Tax=Aestuariirhabdus litorea TaxID=2528527 RepID=A0A3P3VTD4_9GAMM|nr:patatin-like phospholipase family protein [Aestuariirhabdus litorea]RRJ84936.1 alpha/beta hydrolase [Aestuariirhabdus litorea]RWW98161.1 alpha/beta hydrolase [Endozoicomonadaceae bacterium GTF-13]